MSLVIDLKEDIRMVGGKPPSFVRFLGLLFMDSGFLAVFLFRIYSRLYRNNVLLKVLAKIIWRFSVFFCGCYLQPQARIGKGFCLPHPIGVVVGEGASIGEFVKVYQSVTLGQGSCNEYPIIQDNVTIFAATTIVGKITIGSGSTVGANSFVNKDVPRDCIIAGVPAKIIRSVN
jgi:serine O-acetyltransferase